ncbi:unnamed protein product [Orchesella dallaii]|uniref:Uncharacterized protein n=1 Tax=Orchesella dallaii TaxID=48710 RepID=A0ABP1RKK4_9HEXA
MQGGPYVISCLRDIDIINDDKFNERCATLKFLFNQRPGLLESRNHLKLTPVHYACSLLFHNGKQMDFLRFLIKHKADVNAKGIHDLTPLHIGVCSWYLHTNFVALMKTLIPHGANPDDRTEDGFTMLHLAARLLPPLVFHSVVEYLASIGKTKSFTTRDFAGGTALHKAVSKLQPELLQETLDIFKKHGVDFNAVDNEGVSVLLMAKESGYSSIFLDTLRKLGAK